MKLNQRWIIYGIITLTLVFGAAFLLWNGAQNFYEIDQPVTASPADCQADLRFAVIGIAIVFSALTIVSVAVALVRLADRRWEEREKRHAEEAVAKAPTIDTTTLILITAAVATMVTGRFHIRRVRRLLPDDAPRSAWSQQGRSVLHGSHTVSRKR